MAVDERARAARAWTGDPPHVEDVRALEQSLKTLADKSERIAKACESKLGTPP